MVLRASFVRWAHVKNPSPASPRATLFYLQTVEGRKVACALAIRGPTNRITYTAFGAFLDEYHQILPLSDVVQWRFSSIFAQWLNGLLYHSFLLCSEEVNLHTAFLLSAIAKQQIMLKFGFWYLPGQTLRLECKARLNEVFHIFDLEDMVIHMANRTWEIKIQELKLDVAKFEEFWHALVMELLDYLLIIMLSNVEFQVIIFDTNDEIEKIYAWF
ncbi:hypothetical protein RHMOL_Rhmol02G0138600 [Rhododendron molle]|nr:hypothetical protein RHMOL_Rhmol02G0138600 [Rhododendron molle]